MHKLNGNGQVSKNFLRHEFACKCGCGFDKPDAELVRIVQGVRDFFQRPVTINSSCRCKHHNKNVGGAENSTHLAGIAADIVVRDIDAREVYEFLTRTYPDTYGIGRYESFTHIDVRIDRARW